MSKSQELSIKYLKPSELKPHSRNPRKHGRKQQKLLLENVNAHGFINPIIIDETNTILAGHCRQLVAVKAGFSSVPCVQISHLSSAQKIAYVLADNKMSDLGQWDTDLLKLNIEDLLVLDYVVELTGFSTTELDRHFDKKEVTAELIELAYNYQPITRAGDLWQLGEHRVLCGDALESRSYEQLMDGASAQMLFTDPPYNLKISGHVKKDCKEAREFAMASGEMSEQQFTSFLKAFLEQAVKTCMPGAVAYCCMNHRHIVELREAAKGLLEYLQLCVWTKDRAGMGSFYRSQHELVVVFKKTGGPHINNFGLGASGRSRSNVWAYPMVSKNAIGRIESPSHPTPKPISLVADAIRDCSKRNGIVLDPFLGSGTTLLAAELTGRKLYGIELDPIYVDLSILRWQDRARKSAVNLQSGRTYDELKTERLEMNNVQP